MASDVLRVPIAEAARRLGCSVKTLKRRGDEGRLEIVKDADGSEYLSGEEWRDFARRVDHAIHWIEEHTPEDANVPSCTVDNEQ